MATESKLRWPEGRVVGAVLLSPLVVRIMLTIEHDIRVRAGDLRGLALDVAVSLLVAIAVLFVLRIERWGRPAAMVLVALWCLINFGNYEHIRELGSMARLTYAGYLADPTFLLGSGLAFSHPVVFLLVVIVSCAVVWLSPQVPRLERFWLWVLAAVVIFGAAAVLPRDRRLSEWRQTNVVAAQTSRLVA